MSFPTYMEYHLKEKTKPIRCAGVVNSKPRIAQYIADRMDREARAERIDETHRRVERIERMERI